MSETDLTRRVTFGLATTALVSMGSKDPEALAAEVALETHKPLVARIWYGKTPAAKADEYTRYLFDAGIKKIAGIRGNRGVQMMRGSPGPEVEFIVVSYWDSVDAIKTFAGEDYTKTHDLPRDHEFLVDMEPFVRHLDVLVNNPPPAA